MKKVLIGLIMTGSLAISGVAAEKSGAFVGVDLGASAMKVKDTYTNPIDASKNGSIDGSATGFIYGLKGGYKHFQSDKLGIRSYVYLSNASGTAKLDFGLNKIDVKLGVMKYGIGVDILYNFMDNFGVFAGTSVGAISYSLTPGNNEKVTDTGFNNTLNLGIRTVLADMHGIELGVSLSSLPRSFEAIYKDADGYIDAFEMNVQSEVKASYIFNF